MFLGFIGSAGVSGFLGLLVLGLSGRARSTSGRLCFQADPGHSTWQTPDMVFSSEPKPLQVNSVRGWEI